MKLSKPQRELLEDLAKAQDGALRLGGPYLRTATALAKKGLAVSVYRLRVYEITPEGRAAIEPPEPPEFTKGMILIMRGKGNGARWKVKVLSTNGRISLERIQGGPVGTVIRATREQVRMAYEPMP